MAADYVAVAEAYAKEREAYAELAAILKRRIRQRLDDLRLETIVSARAKAVDSFVKKALRKGYADPLTEIADKAGVRVIVHYIDDIEVVETVIADLCEVTNRESKLEGMADDQLGYLGVHLDVQPHLATVSEAKLPGLEHLRAEVQIHTKAQSAWAVVSHELLYKASVPVPTDMRRNVMRLVALVELFDGEVDRFRAEVEMHPDLADTAVLAQLDNTILQFTGRRPDLALSMLSVPALVKLYDYAPAEVFEKAIHPFIETRRDRLKSIFDNYADAEHPNPLLFQPEALLIFERLDKQPDRLKAAWPTDKLGLDLLDEMATIWGVAL